MKILVIGGGGREHAVCKKLSESKDATEILCAPGNAGIAQVARCIPEVKATDVEGIVALAKSEKVDFVCVTPDDPLALGCVDRLEEEGIPAFGPTAYAAQMEASKIFSKNLMRKYGIPTAKCEIFTEMDKALAYLDTQEAPIVVKADGLALGKGVVVAATIEEAKNAVIEMMEGGKFGKSGARVLIEECMVGREVTVLCFCDGKTIRPMPASQDHKRVFDGDKGPNTGGMGAFAPSPLYTEEIAERTEKEILIPTLNAMNSEGFTFKGVLYVGLMLTKDGPKVVEYNARFGDPETQRLVCHHACRSRGAACRNGYPLEEGIGGVHRAGERRLSGKIRKRQAHFRLGRRGNGGRDGIPCGNEENGRGLCDGGRPCAGRNGTGRYAVGCGSQRVCRSGENSFRGRTYAQGYRQPGHVIHKNPNG